MTPAEVDAAIAAVVDAAPPLTDARRATLAALLIPAGGDRE